MEDKELKIFAGKGRVLRQLARDPEWRRKLDRARTDAEVINVLREFSKAIDRSITGPMDTWKLDTNLFDRSVLL